MSVAANRSCIKLLALVYYSTGWPSWRLQPHSAATASSCNMLQVQQYHVVASVPDLLALTLLRASWSGWRSLSLDSFAEASASTARCWSDVYAGGCKAVCCSALRRCCSALWLPDMGLKVTTRWGPKMLRHDIPQLTCVDRHMRPIVCWLWHPCCSGPPAGSNNLGSRVRCWCDLVTPKLVLCMLAALLP